MLSAPSGPYSNYYEISKMRCITFNLALFFGMLSFHHRHQVMISSITFNNQEVLSAKFM